MSLFNDTTYTESHTKEWGKVSSAEWMYWEIRTEIMNLLEGISEEEREDFMKALMEDSGNTVLTFDFVEIMENL